MGRGRSDGHWRRVTSRTDMVRAGRVVWLPLAGWPEGKGAAGGEKARCYRGGCRGSDSARSRCGLPARQLGGRRSRRGGAARACARYPCGDHRWGEARAGAGNQARGKGCIRARLSGCLSRGPPQGGERMTEPRSAPVVVTVSVVTTIAFVVAELGGFALGRSHRVSVPEAAKSREVSQKSAFSVAWHSAYRTALRRGRMIGDRRGRARGVSAGRKAGSSRGRAHRQALLASIQKSQAEKSAAASAGCPSNTVPNAYGAPGCRSPEAFREQNGGSPSVQSEEGKKVIESNPECAAHPPPSEYTGPVQC